MRVSKLFRIRSDRPSVIIAALVAGVVLSVAGSVLATSIGDSVSVTTTLSVTGASTLTGNVGVATSTAGSVFSVQGVGNFNIGTSTLYASLQLPNFSATSTLATSTLSTGGFNIGLGQFVVQQNSGNVGIGSSTPGSLFSIHDVGNFNIGTSTLYASLRLPNFSATSTLATSTISTGGFNVGAGQFVVQQNSGNVGIGSSTPGSLFSIHDVGNFNIGTSTLYASLRLPNFSATSTTATTTISTGGFQVGSQGAAAFTVLQSATTSVGVGTSTPTSHQFAVAGNALIGTSGTTTLLITSSTDATGGCIQMRAASSSDMWRIYIGKTLDGTSSTTGLMVERGPCR